jgi:hypothetical protein
MPAKLSGSSKGLDSAWDMNDCSEMIGTIVSFADKKASLDPPSDKYRVCCCGKIAAK